MANPVRREIPSLLELSARRVIDLGVPVPADARDAFANLNLDRFQDGLIAKEALSEDPIERGKQMYARIMEAATGLLIVEPQQTLDSLVQEIKDRSLYSIYIREIRLQTEAPSFSINEIERIRSWMQENQHLFPRITLSSKIPVVPTEIELLKNLETLAITSPSILTLPESYSPPSLQRLIIRDSKITHLPASFNPPNMRMIVLPDRMHIEAQENVIQRFPKAFIYTNQKALHRKNVFPYPI